MVSLVRLVFKDLLALWALPEQLDLLVKLVL